MAKPRIKTTKQEIAHYWKDKIDQGDINVTYKQATSHCWRCGIKKRLDRCHIKPDALGGGDTPENFVLLCKHCHIDNPNLNDVDIVWDWLSAYHLDDQPFWYHQGLREYEYIYEESLNDALKRLDISRATFDQALEETMTTVGHHFGQPRHNRATVAGAIRITLNKLTKEPLI